MASGPITSWQIGGEKVEILLASKMAADGDCNQETKRHLFFGRKATTDLDSVWKSRDIHFADKGPCSQSYSFSSSHVWMWELNYKEGWEPKKCYFKLWCWRRLLRVPWTARRSNQSILKEINEYSLEGLILKLKLPYFGHLIWRAHSLENTLMLWKIEGRRRMG